MKLSRERERKHELLLGVLNTKHLWDMETKHQCQRHVYKFFFNFIIKSYFCVFFVVGVFEGTIFPMVICCVASVYFVFISHRFKRDEIRFTLEFHCNGNIIWELTGSRSVFHLIFQINTKWILQWTNLTIHFDSMENGKGVFSSVCFCLSGTNSTESKTEMFNHYLFVAFSSSNSLTNDFSMLLTNISILYWVKWTKCMQCHKCNSKFDKIWCDD